MNAEPKEKYNCGTKGRAMAPTDIIARLKSELPGAEVLMDDISCSRNKFSMTVIAPQFEGLMMLKQHRMIYDIMADCFEDRGGAIHALVLSTFTPEEWRNKNQT